MATRARPYSPFFTPLVTRGQRDKQQDEPAGWTRSLQKAAVAKGAPGSAQGMFACLVSCLLATGLQLSLESREWVLCDLK